MRRLLFFAFLLTAAAPLRSQVIHRIGRPTADTSRGAPVETAPRRAVAEGHATLSGIVFDSLRDEPVRGATVLVVGSRLQTKTDSAGMYHFDVDSIPEGVVTIGFFLGSLDSLGITPPVRQIGIHHGQSELLDLGVPSMRTVLRVVCRDSATGGRGMMMGVVRDADSDVPLPGALVVVMWSEVNIGSASLTKLPRASHTTVGSNGNYRLCGLPNGVQLRAQARLDTKQSGWIDVTMPPGGVLQRDFLLGQRPVPVAAATSPPRGTTPAAAPVAPRPLGSAVLTGTVVGADGKPLEGAQVYLVGTAVGARADYRGIFRLSGLPSGTQTVEVRLLSYAPRRFTVDLSPARESKLAAVMDTRATVLGTIEVEAKKHVTAPGFEDRQKRGLGTFLTRDDIDKQQPILLTDLFRSVPGVTVGFDGSNYIVQSSRGSATGCQMSWYVDGSPFDNSQGDMDQMLRPDDIEAVEVYKSASEVPVQYQGRGASCGTILVWTKRAAAGRAKRSK